jgi:hypothetical protein
MVSVLARDMHLTLSCRHLIRPQAQQEDLGTQQSNDQQIGISRASRGRSQQVVQLVEEPILGEQEEQQGAQQHLVVLADQLGQSPLQPSHHVVVSNSIPLQAPIDSSISSVSQVPVQGTSQLEHPLQGTVFGDLSLQPLGRSRRSLSPFAVAALRLRLTPQRFLTTLAFLFVSSNPRSKCYLRWNHNHQGLQYAAYAHPKEWLVQLEAFLALTLLDITGI